MGILPWLHVAVAVVATWIYYRLWRQGNSRGVLLLILLLVLWSLPVAAVLLWGWEITGFLGVVGCLPMVAAVLLVTITLGVAAARHHPSREKARQVPYWRTVVILAALCFLPLFVAKVWQRGCEAKNRRLMRETVIPAMEAYRLDRGTYPSSIEELLPSYLKEIPALGCRGPYRWFGSAERHRDESVSLVECPSRIVLVFPDLGDQYPHRYDPTKGVWWRYSFLDGPCAYLD